MSTINSSYLSTLDSNLAAQTVADPEALQNVIDNYATVINANSPEGQYAADAGSTDAYAITLSPAPSAYFTGMVVRFKANTANTGIATLNVNGLGAKTIKIEYNSDLITGDIVANQVVAVIYDGTNFQMLSPSSNRVKRSGDTITGDVTVSRTGADATFSIQTTTSGNPTLELVANGVNLGQLFFERVGSSLKIKSGTNEAIIIPTTNGNVGFAKAIYLLNGFTLTITAGTGSPEGVVTANVGSLFLRTDGGATTTLYVKTSGTGNTGWTAK